MDKDKVFIEETINYTIKENITTTTNNNNSTTSLQRGKQNRTKRVVNILMFFKYTLIVCYLLLFII
jgi:hypothetical protein